MVLYDTIDAMIATIYWLGFSLQHDFNSHKLYAMCGAVGKKKKKHATCGVLEKQTHVL